MISETSPSTHPRTPIFDLTPIELPLNISSESTISFEGTINIGDGEFIIIVTLYCGILNAIPGF